MAIDVNGVVNLAGAITTWLGANRWDLQPAIYTNSKGQKAIFYGLDADRRAFDLSAIGDIPIYGQAYNAVMQTVKGFTDEATPLYQQAMKGVTDSQNRKLVKYRIPNFDGGVIIDLGTDIRQITVQFMVWDTNYRQKLIEFEEVFTENKVDITSRKPKETARKSVESNAQQNITGMAGGDVASQQVQGNILRHPVLGRFEGVYVDNYEVVGTSDIYNCGVVRVTFAVAKPIATYQEDARTKFINAISKWTLISGQLLTSINTAVSFTINNLPSIIRNSTPFLLANEIETSSPVLPALQRKALLMKILNTTPPNIKFSQVLTTINDMLGQDPNIPYRLETYPLYSSFVSQGFATPDQIDYLVSDFIENVRLWQIILTEERDNLDKLIGAMRVLAREKYQLYSRNLRIITTTKVYTLRELAYDFGVEDLTLLAQMNYNQIRNHNYIPAGTEIYLWR